MNKKANLFFCGAFVASLFLVPAMIFLLGRDNQTAYYENRLLATIPDFSLEELLNGDYADPIESWVSDHVPLREKFIALNVWIDCNVLQKPVVNDMILGDVLLPFNDFSQWGLSYLDPIAQTSVANQMQIPALLEDWGGVYCYVGIPLQNSYFNDQYPSYTASRQWHIEGMRNAFTQEAQAQGLPFLDMMTIFEQAGMPETFYAKSDHHYTYYGAFATYQATMDYLSQTYGLTLPTLSESDIDIVAVDTPFLGSRNREIYNLWDGSESFYIGLQTQEIPFQRWDNGVEVPATLYTLPTDIVTYSAYMGGDIGETRITTNRPDLPNLLIFGDSFTNPLETLFYTSFNETRSLDLRYYTQEGILSYLAAYQPDVVVCIRDDHSYVLDTYNGSITW